MLLDQFRKYRIILASGSPRRQELLMSLGLEIEVKTGFDVDESYPDNLKGEEVPVFLAEKKSDAYSEELGPDDILITADTIVYQDSEVLNKPDSYEEAFATLKKLSGNSHYVYTGVCLRSKQFRKTFLSKTRVRFGYMTDEEISFYIENFKPFDKAGAYGIQEWIGYIGVEEIEGSYFNVMGLPVHQIYRELESFVMNKKNIE